MTTTNWLERLVDLARREGPTVRIVIIEVAGPTPREVGAELLVTARSAIGKIGRPAFEQNMIDLARRLITQRSGPQRGEPSPWQRRIVVDATGPVLGEVSGGELTLLFEVFGAHEIARLSELASASSIVARPLACGVPMMLDDVLAKASDASTAGSWPRVVAAAAAHLRQSPIETRILAPSPKSPTESDRWAGGWLIERTAPHAVAFYVYGSGLVARALVHALAGLPFDLIWIDTEPAHFPDGIPDHAKPLASTDPAAIAASAPTGAFHAVMTVSHDLDAAIVEALARRDVFGFAGVIGSTVKRRRLLDRLASRGIPEATLARLVCPLGLPGIRSKQPAVIAIAIAAQALLALNAARDAADQPPGSNR